MTRLMFDSTNVADIPQSARMVGFYIDGRYAISKAAVRARFPTATLVPISAIGTNAGIVGDVEPGCMSAQQGVAWCKKRRAAGLDPSIYCNERNSLAWVQSVFRYYNQPQPHYWCSNYARPPALLFGEVAHQYANPDNNGTGGHYDLSLVADFWPGVDTIGMVRLDPDDPTVKMIVATYRAIGDGAVNPTAIPLIADAVAAKVNVQPADLTQLKADVSGIKAIVTAIQTKIGAIFR